MRIKLHDENMKTKQQFNHVGFEHANINIDMYSMILALRHETKTKHNKEL